MSHVPHALQEEFPELSAQISELKQTNAHFAKLAEAYHEVNRQVHRAESKVAPLDTVSETELRKKRSALKDEIYKMLTVAS
jgi:uncharacterized protein YdcH (DUF465 family)